MPRRRRNRNTEREKARRLSGKLLRARYLKPERCERCNKKTKWLQGHHLGTSWAELYKLGLHLDVEKHNISYICIECHKWYHRLDPFVHLIGKRGRSWRRRKAKKKA